MSHATDSIAFARQRALRAARAVTLTMLASGCSSAVMPSTQDAMADVAPDVQVAVDASPTPDVTPDAAPDVTADASPEDAGDGGEDCSPLRGTDQYIACCERINWDFRRGCEAWGPFMPPAGEA